MIDKEKILTMISEGKWACLASMFSVSNICHVLSYKECMALAYDLFFKNLYNDGLQDFAIKLFVAVSKDYPAEWDGDWKNDVFLGKLCSITWKYDEMYKSYKKAYDRLIDPPDSLLLLLASCNSTPGTPPISNQESERYLKRAIQKKITYEAAIMMRGLAIDKIAKDQEEYWSHMCEELEKQNIHTETIIPDVLSVQNRG